MRKFDPAKVPRPNVSFTFMQARIYDAIDLEIGCGVGRYAIESARLFPLRAYIAVEKTVERFGKFHRRVQNHPPMPNLFAVHAEAASFITHFIPEDSIDHIYLLYPNPYPKLKQRNLRWHNRAFMGFLLNRLRSGGRLTLATNLDDFHEEAVARMTSTWHQNPVEDRVLQASQAPRTHFEKKYLLRGETCWNMVFEKP